SRRRQSALISSFQVVPALRGRSVPTDVGGYRTMPVPCSLFMHSNPRTKLPNLTIWTIRTARITSPPPMPNQPMAEQRPLLIGNKLHQVLLDFHRRSLLR